MSGPDLSGLRAAFSSRRTLAVTLLSFSSGLPLGLVWISIPDWMRKVGYDLPTIGLITLTHAPWTFKMVWSPLMDRYAPPWLGRRRGWIAICQIALVALTLLLGGLGSTTETAWIILSLCLAMAFASASQDIALDAYAVEVLRPEEQGIAVGARTAVYRAAMFVAGGLTITLLSWFSWAAVATALALLYVPMLVVTRLAPREDDRWAPPQSLRDAIWLPFLGFLGRHRALEILAFVFFYKFADQLAQSLQRPFFYDMGYGDLDRGIGLATVGLLVTLVGTFLGGMLTTVIGLGHSLWIFGFLQIFSNIGYVLVARSEPDRLLLYGAFSFETLTTGLGMGAFGVLLLRITQKRFSATQYALFSSLFALPRLIAGPVTGTLSEILGWETFFWITMLFGIPGLLLLARFVPPGTRDPVFSAEPPRYGAPLAVSSLVGLGLLGGFIAMALAISIEALLAGLESAATTGFDIRLEIASLLRPTDISSAVQLAGAAVFGMVGGLGTAAVFAARHGAGVETDDEHA